MSKRAYRHRLLLPSRRLVRPAADNDFDVTKKKEKLIKLKKYELTQISSIIR